MKFIRSRLNDFEFVSQNVRLMFNLARTSESQETIKKVLEIQMRNEFPASLISSSMNKLEITQRFVMFFFCALTRNIFFLFRGILFKQQEKFFG